MAVGTPVAAAPGTIIRVRAGGQLVGELNISDNRLLKGAKTLKRRLGRRVASVVILTIMTRFIRQDDDFGSVVYKDQRYTFSTAASEDMIAAPKKRKLAVAV